MPISTNPTELSTNPNTIKVRRRKMNLSGEKKVEDAAKAADYKALVNARKVVQLQPEYGLASNSEKTAMLEQAMKETMEKRRARGQDTMSKIAAFKAGAYRVRDSITGPQPRAPIPDFLQNNGFVPLRPGKAPQPGASVHPSGTGPANMDPLTPTSLGSASGAGGAFAGANGLPYLGVGRSGHALADFNPQTRHAIAPAHRHLPSNSSSFESQSSPNSSFTEFKASGAPTSFLHMSPEPMLASIEGDGLSTNGDDLLARIRAEMRDICRSAFANRNNNIGDLEFHNVESEMEAERTRVTDLEVRVNQLEGMVHALQNTAIRSIASRVDTLESIVDDLKEKVGSGCDDEVAKMREVFGGLKGVLDKVGGFV
ncbi:hypothetical protein Daus18300_006683 [Diaporthe australafricana]|uniref:Uncharacterized protein n=1 Tax=Diaporthe australafricana TaxID=127596 RepID=A0ABR3WST4_9PEZI